MMVVQDAVLGHLLESSGSYLEMKIIVLMVPFASTIIGKVLWEVENHLGGNYHAIVWTLQMMWHFLLGVVWRTATQASFSVALAKMI